MFYLACKLISTTTGFLFPAYSSYKAIRTNDAQAIETWLMYWVVMAGLHAVENTVEWTVNWIPFYYEIKSIVIVWLTLPQIQGSTFVYVTYIHPFLLSHESEIDATVSQAKTKARAAGLDYMRRAWLAVRDAVVGAIVANGGDPQAAAALTGAPAQTNPPPAAATQPSGPANAPPSPTPSTWAFANNALRTYGPAALAAGHALFRPMQASGQSADALHKKDDDYHQDGRSANAIGRGPPPASRDYADQPSAGMLGTSLADAAYRTASSLGATAALRSALNRDPQRLYQQEVTRPTADRRVMSASAAVGGTSATASAYSGYSREQLRQRRLELEAELAALEAPNTSFTGPSSPGGDSLHAPTGPTRASRTPSPIDSPNDDSLRAYPPSPARDRGRHVSGPVSSRGGRISPLAMSMTSPLDASAYETIRREEAENIVLPPDWGRSASRDGWKGAPPHQGQPGTAASGLSKSMGPSSTTKPSTSDQQIGAVKRQSWFWNSPALPPVPAEKDKKQA